MRISQENENSQRPSGLEPQTPRRPQKAHHRLTFPKKARLRSSHEYQRLRKSGRRTAGRMVYLEYRAGRGPCPKLGITVSRKYGKAHERNRFKRLVREAFREISPVLPYELELNVAPRIGVEPTKVGILQDFSLLPKC